MQSPHRNTFKHAGMWHSSSSANCGNKLHGFDFFNLANWVDLFPLGNSLVSWAHLFQFCAAGKGMSCQSILGVIDRSVLSVLFISLLPQRQTCEVDARWVSGYIPNSWCYFSRVFQLKKVLSRKKKEKSVCFSLNQNSKPSKTSRVSGWNQQM